MRRITLSKLELCGFKSFTTPTVVAFTPGAGLKFLSGDNQVEPRLGANGAGKALANSLEIDTPIGKRRWGCLRVGDYVFGRDGRATRITGKYPQGKKQLYRVTFDDGCSTLACEDHLWQVERWARSGRDKEAGVFTTKQLVEKGVTFQSGNATIRWQIPRHAPVDFWFTELPIDPYVLGLWLGDGSKTASAITVDARDTDVIDYLLKVSYDYIPNGARTPCDFADRERIRANPTCGNSKTVMVFGLLPKLKVLGLGSTKGDAVWVPEAFLYTSAKNRLQLLRGLLDSDGYCDQKGSCEFCSTSERLAQDVAWLVRSLGGKAHIRRARHTRYKDAAGNSLLGRLSYTVSIALKTCPFFAQRKAVRYRTDQQARYFTRFITAIEPDCVADASCITVEAEDGLFLANDFIVTHNSSLWDALTWCLFGATARGHRVNDVLSWGAKFVRVAAYFQIDGQETCVMRSGPPTRMLVDDMPVEQREIDQLFGLSRLRFLHSVLFGQAVPLFLDLPISERGVLLDEVLDLGHWLDLSDRASKRHKALQEQIGEIDKQLAYHRGVLAGLEDEAKLQQLHDAWETSYQADIDEAIGLVEQGEIEHAKRTKALTRMKRQRDALATVTNITKKIAEEREAAAKLQISLARTRDARTDAQTQLAFYSSHDACPTCQQTLTPAFIAKQSKRLQKELAQLEVEVEQLESQVKYYADSVRQLEADRDRQQQERQVLDRQIVAEETALRQIQASINQLAQRVEDMAANRQNPYAARLAELQSTKSRIDKALADYTGQRDQLQGECLLVDFWRNGFKRVRLFLVAQVLTSLEAEVASAASALGLPGWRIVFTTEKETKAGTTRPGIRVHVTSPHAQGPWEVWSGGELQRIRLSVAIGLSSLIQRMSGIYYTWEVWDEPSAWLSAEGIEDLLTALQYRAEVSDKAVWLLDHRALTFGGFSEIWQVQKTPEGSRIALLARDE